MPPPPDRSQILWYDTLPDAIEPRPALAGREQADVVIVGAGYSGLWTAYYLTTLDPGLNVAIVEAEIAGHGASGRNGGWCTGGLSGVEGLLARKDQRPAGMALQRAAFDAVDEVGRVAAKEGIDCHYQKGGSIRLATTEPQRAALAHHMEELKTWGFAADDYRWLDPAECTRHVRSPRTLGALFTPHCASLHPTRLARGLAARVEQRGVRIFESSPVRRFAAGRVETADGELRGRTVLRATEGYTRTLPSARRQLVPLHSMMIATEPLSEELWAQIGLGERQTFGDGRRLVIYGQRTADGRLAFGARGEYRFGSGIEDWFHPNDPRFEAIREALIELFPALADVRITHRWGGALGVPRNWRPSVGLDAATRVGWLGGYVGQGVAASNLAGRTLAELVVGERSERTTLAWVGPQSRPWEPEPLRFAAVRGIARAGESADRYELRTGRTPWLRGRLFDLFVSR